MKRFSNCRLELLDAGGARTFVDDDCEVRLEGERIAISWFDDEGPVMFVGTEREPGHFDLVCRSRPRSGSVSRIGEGAFEGQWSEDEQTARFRIELGEPQP